MRPTALLIGIFLAGLAFADENSRSSTGATGSDAEALKTYRQYQLEVSAVIRRESSAAALAERGAAIEEMARLFRAVQQDPRYATSGVLQRHRARLWGRLTMIKTSLEREMSGLERQLGREANGKHGNHGNNNSPDAAETTRILAANLDVVAYSLGGPGKIFSQGSWTRGSSSSQARSALGGAAQLDYGRELVELIERTIKPSFWDVNGGPGSIVYFAPLHALVVSATEEVHEKIGGILR